MREAGDGGVMWEGEVEAVGYVGRSLGRDVARRDGWGWAGGSIVAGVPSLHSAMTWFVETVGDGLRR